MTDADPTPSADQADLTPRPPRPRRRWAPFVVVVVVAVAIGGLALSLARSASVSVYEADQAVEKRAGLDDERFRLIGTPVEGTVIESEYQGQGAVSFTVVFDDVMVDVVHVGDPPELFAAGEGAAPVFLEGQWIATSGADVDDFTGGVNDGWFFASDTMRVKHDEDYTNDNDERIERANEGGSA